MRAHIGLAVATSVALCAPLLARAQGTLQPKPIVLEVLYQMEMEEIGTNTRAREEVRGRYEVQWNQNPFSNRWGAAACTGYEVAFTSLKDGEPFCFRLKYAGGEAVRGEGVFQGQAVRFVADYPKLDRRWVTQNDGSIHSRPDGKVELLLGERPGYQVEGDDPRGCATRDWPEMVVTYADVRNLRQLERRWTAPSFTEEQAQDCRGTITVTVRATSPQ